MIPDGKLIDGLIYDQTAIVHLDWSIRKLNETKKHLLLLVAALCKLAVNDLRGADC